MLDSGSLAGDFIAKRVVSQLKLEHHVVSNKSRTVCSGLDCKCFDISNTRALYVFYFNKLLKNVAYFKMYAIILESSPIDLLLGRKTRKKFDLFNQVPSQSKDFDEKTITAVLKLLESVKLSHDCQPRVALLFTQSITKEFRHLSQVKSPTVYQTQGTLASLVLEVEHLLGVPTPDDDETVHEKGETFAPWLTSDSTVDVLSLINVKGDSNLQENIRTLCTELKDIFSNELPAEPAKIEPFNLVVVSLRDKFSM